jgi:hypothetical protein
MVNDRPNVAGFGFKSMDASFGPTVKEQYSVA